LADWRDRENLRLFDDDDEFLRGGIPANLEVRISGQTCVKDMLAIETPFLEVPGEYFG
jgi:hypothetical protein